MCACSSGYIAYDPPQISCGPGTTNLIYKFTNLACGNSILDIGEEWYALLCICHILKYVATVARGALIVNVDGSIIVIATHSQVVKKQHVGN